MYYKHCEKLKRLSKIAKKCRLLINNLKQSKITLWCFKLKYRKLSHMLGLLNKSVWVNPPIAPPSL